MRCGKEREREKKNMTTGERESSFALIISSQKSLHNFNGGSIMQIFARETMKIYFARVHSEIKKEEKRGDDDRLAM
jgi:hypothetical protein